VINAVTVCTTATAEHAIGSLRLHGPLRAAGIEMYWHMPGQEFDPDEAASKSDLFIIQRDYPRYAAEYANVRKAAANAHKAVVYELDDLLWDLPPDHPDRKVGYYTPALYPMLLAALEADAMTAASPGLCTALQPLNPSVWLLPNYLNEQLWTLRKPEVRPDSTVWLGYMGGDSHLPDIQMIQPVLLNLLESYGGQVRLKFWGIRPPAELFPHPYVEWEALQPGNYTEFSSYFSRQTFDIFLAPLQNNPFNCCKSAIKFLEYTALGVPGVCSQASPYQSVVQQGVTGYLAANLDEWHQYLSLLIENAVLRQQIAHQAQDAVRQNWLLSDHAHLWPEAYQAVLDGYQPATGESLTAELAAHIQELLEASFAQQAQVLNQRESELAEIKSSRAWKLISRYRGWRSRFSRSKSQNKQD
jgi:processive 1,2-diacylglycerol beta-glucosyltransferase